MNREEFCQRLKECGIDPRDVMAGNQVSDGFGLRKNGYRWEVFRRERGMEYDTLGFPSESDALQWLFEEITG